MDSIDTETLIQTIEKVYFEDKENFNLDHLTSRLPANLTSEYLLSYKEELEKLLAVVSRKASELILSHQPTYVDELQRIASLQQSISESIRVCTQARSCLKFISGGTAKNGSTIVDHYKKRESLTKLLDSLKVIDSLRRTFYEIRSLIDSRGNFPKAIQLCKDGMALLALHQEYKCVNELGQKLNDTIELIGEQVDTVLSKMCLSFDPAIYAKLQTSYSLMDRSEIAVDQLLMHFSSTINSQSHLIVMKNLDTAYDETHVEKKQEANDASDSKLNTQFKTTKSRKDFQELCKLIPMNKFIDCLVELCTTFWFIMLNYRKILRWHDVEVDERGNKGDNEVKDIKTLFANDETQQSHIAKEKFKEIYVEQKLISGLGRLWYDMRRKLTLVISCHNFSCYRFDEFLRTLNIVDLMMRIGNDFCNAPSSADLRDCVNKQALNFFNAYHQSSTDELKMFLDNELWEVVPVKNDFKLAHLREFSFLRSQLSHLTENIKPTANPISQSTNNYLESDQSFFKHDAISKHDDMDLEQILDRIKAPHSTPSKLKSVIPFEYLLQTTKDASEDLFGSGECYSFLEREGALPLDKISLSDDSDDGDKENNNDNFDDEDDLNSELHKDTVEEDEFVSSEDEPEQSKTKFAGSSSSGAPGDDKQLLISGCIRGTNRYTLIRGSGPVLTNSSLNVLRLMGRYIQMMKVLEPISYEILMKIYNLLDYYTLNVYKRFGPDSEKKSDDKNLSPKLRVVIRSIRESLLGGNSGNNFQSLDDARAHSGSPTKKSEEGLNLTVEQGVTNITNTITQDLMIGQMKYDSRIDPMKAVGVESLIFLVNQLWNLQEYLESLIPVDMRPQLREQFSQNNSIVPDFLKARSELGPS